MHRADWGGVKIAFPQGGAVGLADEQAAEGRGIPVVAPLVALTVLSWIAFGMSPWLMQWPLVLIALNPRMLFLLLVAPKVGFVEFTLIATARLCIADPFSYLVGVRYGPKLRARIERTRLRTWIMRFAKVEKTAAMIALWIRPSQLILMWSGSMRLSPKYVALVDVMTTVLYVVAIHQGLNTIF